MASGKVILNDDRPLFRRIKFTSNKALTINPNGTAGSIKKKDCNFYVPDGYVPFSITRADGGGNTVSITRAGMYSSDDGYVATGTMMTVLNQTTSTRSVTPSFTMVFIRSDCLDISKTKRILKFVFDEYENKPTYIRCNKSVSYNPYTAGFDLTSYTPDWFMPGTTIQMKLLENSNAHSVLTNTSNFDIVVTYGNDLSMNLHEITVNGLKYTEFIMPDHDVTITLTAK